MLNIEENTNVVIEGWYIFMNTLVLTIIVDTFFLLRRILRFLLKVGTYL